jgi:quinol monooxygenase YgiN
MASTVSLNLQLSVRDGQLDGARALMAEMVEATREEPGTLGYEWFLSADGGTCHVCERYADSDAALAHFGNFGANFAERFLGCFEPTGLSVYGEPSDEARGAFDGFGAAYLGTFGGFSR